MKFIVDAQLPRKLAKWLSDRGFDTIHTLDLPDKNRTTDTRINQISMLQKRVVISKDSDFYERFFQKAEPWKLIFLTTGNISTEDLILLFELNFDFILNEIRSNNVVEISRTAVITID